MPVLGTMSAGGSLLDGLNRTYLMSPNYVLWFGGFYFNYFYLVPKFYNAKKYTTYGILTAATYIILGSLTPWLYRLINDSEWKGTGNAGLDTVINIGQIVLNMLLCLLAIMFRVQQRNAILEQQVQSTPAPIFPVVTEPAPTAEEPTYIFVKCEARQVRVNYADILYINAMKDYVRIYLTTQQRPLIAYSTMKAIEEKLPSTQFCRVHRSYIVSMSKIESVERNRIRINGEYIPVSETYQNIFNERMQ